MKKILCLLLALALTLSLVACGSTGADEDDVRGEIVGGNTDNDTNSDASADENDKPGFSLGQATGNTYKNDFLGISCTLPSEWTFYTEKEILELNNITSDFLDEETKELLENANIIYDMYASTGEGSTINVNLEKVPANMMSSVNIKQTLESQKDSLVATYEQMGYTNVQTSVTKVTIDGKQFDALTISASIAGYDFNAAIFMFQKENYLAAVSLGGLGDNQIETYLGYFDVQ